MPVRATNVNAFDLKLLKGLLNLKLNGSHLADVSTEQKRELSKKYDRDGGIINLNAEHLSRIWPKQKEISHSITLNTLNQLCSILKEGYRWHLFTADILKFRPEGIPNEKPYSALNRFEKEKVDTAIEELFQEYGRFAEFEMEVINKNKASASEKRVNHKTLDDDEMLASFISKIYVELTTRKAGISIDEDNDVIEEIYNSWYKLFCIIRDELKQLPKIDLANTSAYPIQIAYKILNDILRPHLTEHQAKFRKWFESAKQNPKNKHISPQELQKKYNLYITLIKSIQEVNNELILCSKELSKYLVFET